MEVRLLNSMRLFPREDVPCRTKVRETQQQRQCYVITSGLHNDSMIGTAKRPGRRTDVHEGE